MSDLSLEFVCEWKDHKVGDIAVYNEVIAAELMGSGIAINADAKASQARESALSKGYHEAKLKGLCNRRVFLQNQIAMIDKQVMFEEEYLKGLTVPPKDKMIKRAAVSKEV